jgi:YgiT-type zinc finger domain-containing protein
MNNFQDKAGFIWQVADDILRGAFKQHEYGEVILPFVVLRRMDCVLEKTKDNVIAEYKKYKDKLDDSTVIFKKVPADICNNCGEYYLSEDITDQLLTKAEDAAKNGAEIEILKYIAA